MPCGVGINVAKQIAELINIPDIIRSATPNGPLLKKWYDAGITRGKHNIMDDFFILIVVIWKEMNHFPEIERAELEIIHFAFDVPLTHQTIR